MVGPQWYTWFIVYNEELFRSISFKIDLPFFQLGLEIFRQVLYYRFRFLQSETFDNRFITRDLEEIDWRRTLHNRETILPLSRRESGK